MACVLTLESWPSVITILALAKGSNKAHLATSLVELGVHTACHASAILRILVTTVFHHVNDCRDAKGGETDQNGCIISKHQNEHQKEHCGENQQHERKSADWDTVRTVHYNKKRRRRGEPLGMGTSLWACTSARTVGLSNPQPQEGCILHD